MNDSSEINIIAMIALTVAIVATIAIMYNAHRNYLIATSDDPLITACALSSSDAKPCMAYLGSLK
jgi:hypothetical protein